MEIPCSYYIWTNFSIFFSCVSIFFSLLFGIFSWWYFNWEFRNKQIFYIFTCLSSIFLLVQSIDPLSLFGLISQTTINVLSNISTWLSFALFGTFIIAIMQVVEYRELFNRRLKYVYLALGSSFIFTIVSSILQTSNPIWHSIKLFVMAFSLVCFTIGIDYYFIKILKLFDRLNNDGIDTNNRQTYFKTFITIFHLLILLIVIVQIYWGINLLNNPILETQMSWENILLFSLHLIILIVSEFFFLGRFKIELT